MIQHKARSKEVLFLSGWLFTDLLLLLTMLFFISNVDAKPVKALPTPSPTPLLRLELTPHRVSITIDAEGILHNLTGSVEIFKQQMRGQHFLQKRSVGLVIAYGGAPTDGDIHTALDIANKVYAALGALGQQGFAFGRASYYHPLYYLGNQPSQVLLDIYLFSI